MIQINDRPFFVNYTSAMEYTLNNDIELFEDLDDGEIASLLAISQEKKYQKNNILFFEGECPKKLHLLLDGIVKVYKVDAKGNEIILHFFQAQSLIAETAHMQKMLFPATAMCETDCAVLEIDYGAFEKEFLRNPDISFKIIRSLSKKVKALQSVITTNLTMDTFARVCTFLCENESHIGAISHRKIASILNITPETLSRHIAILKKEGVVAVEKRKIIVLDKARLSSY